MEKVRQAINSLGGKWILGLLGPIIVIWLFTEVREVPTKYCTKVEAGEIKKELKADLQEARAEQRAETRDINRKLDKLIDFHMTRGNR